MTLIQTLLAKAAYGRQQLVQGQQRLSIWTAVVAIGLFSGQANAANKIATMICTFKNQFFDNFLIGAIFVCAAIAACIYKMMADDNKFKETLIGLFAMLALISAIPDIAGYLGYAAC